MATYDRLKAAADEVVAATNEVIAQGNPPPPPPSSGGLIDSANPLSGWHGESDHAGGSWGADTTVLRASANGRLVVTSAADHQFAAAVRTVSGLTAGQSKTLTVAYEAGTTPPAAVILQYASGGTNINLIESLNLTGNGTLTQSFTVPSTGSVNLNLLAYTRGSGSASFVSASIS
jgi:hypothetical protein